MTNSERHALGSMINGCPVYWTNGRASIIQHPRGWMLYTSGRVGTFRRFPSAWKRAQTV